MIVRPAAPRPHFDQREFHPALLARARWDQGVTISVCLPARNEASTVGQIVDRVRRELHERWGLVDEVIVLDDGSVDGSATERTEISAHRPRRSSPRPLRRAGHDRSGEACCELLRFDLDHRPEVEQGQVGERPPMAAVPA
jgi:hypothetical protein